MAVEDNQVLLRLILKGMDPEEVRRLADETYGQLKTEAAQHIDALTDYYKQSAQAQTDAAKQTAQEKIDAETSALDAVTKLMRQQEIEANKARGAWHGIMEDLENITTVATAAFHIMSDGFERLKSAAEEIIKDTNIYNSLTGSIDEMRNATEGAVANIDLISAKNRAFEKDLKLTDQQFGLVSAAAAHYAHAVGIDVKEALDKMIDGMATGRAKMLEHAGIVVKAAEANEHWAEKMGASVDAMTEQEKLIAFQTEALEKMRVKMEDVGEVPDTLAERFERGFVRIKNAITDTAAAIGNINIGAFLDPAGAYSEAREQEKKRAERAKKAAEEAFDKEHADFQDSNATGGADYLPGVPDNQQEIDARGKAKIGDKRGDAAAKAAAAKAAQAEKADESFFSKLGAPQGDGKKERSEGLVPDDDLEKKAGSATSEGGTDDYIKAAAAADAADEKRIVMMARVKGLAVDAGVAYLKLADSMGLEVDALTHEEKMQALSTEQKVKAEEFAKKAKKEADTRRAELKATEKKAGFLGEFLWGPDGPDQTYQEMDAFHQKLVDSSKEMSDMLTGSGKQMANAMGQSLAATLSGAAGHKKSMKEMTHDTLAALSEQAIVKALYSTAEGIADLAHYDYPGAAESFAAAAAFAAVGVAAGAGARATAPSASAASAAPAQAQGASGSGSGSGISSSRSSNFGSGGQTSSGSSQNPGSPVTINMTVMPGGEAESGRQVMRALTALQQQTGQSVQPLMGTM